MRVFPLVLAHALAFAPAFAAGQAHPTKPVRIVFPYPRGGGGDFHARFVGYKLSTLFGQPVIVDGNIRNEYAARAAPNSHTSLWRSTNMAMPPCAINATVPRFTISGDP